MAKRQSFMMETKTFDFKKPKTELPSLPSKKIKCMQYIYILEMDYAISKLISNRDRL